MIFDKKLIVMLVVACMVHLLPGCSNAKTVTIERSAKKLSIAHEIEKISRSVSVLDHANPTSNNSSSNPYDYIKDNPNYDEVIRTGYDALPILEENLKNSNASGLREYVVCIAIEEITNCDLKQFQDYQWESAENFKLKWNQYLKDIPAMVYRILNSSSSPKGKEQEITKLGAPAIPYVVLYAESIDKEQNSEMSATLGSLIKNGRPAKTVTGFKKNNWAIIQKLQKYIENR